MTGPRSRRRFIRLAATASVASATALAGCGGGARDGTDEDGAGEDGPTGTSPGPTDAATPSQTETPTGQPSPNPAPPSPTRSPAGDGSAVETVGAPTNTDSAPWTPTADAPASFDGYERTTVRVDSPSDERLGAVRAAVSDTRDLRYTGLSDTESLPTDWGMLFVYESVGDRTYVMRRMDFAIDIVYVDADGEITSIHHAPAPGPDEDGNEQEYSGRGQYVLEVNFEWTSERGIGEGDVLQFDL